MIKPIYTAAMMLVQGSEIGPPSPGGGYGPDAPKLPIDGDIWILMLLGVILGMIVVYRRYRLKDRLS